MVCSVVKALPVLLLLVLCAKTVESCVSHSGCRHGQYCCSSGSCCDYGDFCYNTSTNTYFCEQGYHCCGPFNDKCCTGNHATKTSGPTMIGVLIGSVLACLLAKRGNSSLL